MEEIITSKKTDYWLTVYAATAVTMAGVMANSAFDTSSMLLSCAAGAAGGLLSSVFYFAVKKRGFFVKLAAYVLLVAVIFFAGLWGIRIHSDEYIVSRDWNTVTIGNVTFEYPGTFEQFDNGVEKKDGSIHMDSFVRDEGKRLALYMNYDILENTPSMVDSFTGAVTNSMESVSAVGFEWTKLESTDNSIYGFYRYKIDQTELTGFAFIYNAGTHFELISFQGYSKNYSPEYLNKVKNSIKINS